MAKTGAIAKLTAMAKERQYAGGGIAKLAKRLKGTQETLPAAEREANKAKFLAESKTPMRLYHGTTASEGGKGTESIRRFKPSKEGALGSGVYLTPDPKFAGSYAEQVGSSMLPVYAQLKNPLILRGSGVPDKYKDPMIEALELLGMDSAKAARMVERAYEGKGYIGKEVQTRAQAQGYDGLIEYDRDGKLAEVVSYNPNAVKSAIGNRGTYDTRSPELNKAKGGDVHMKKGGEPVDPRFRTAGGDPLDQFAPPRYRSAGRRPESQQDREASANIPVAVARGLVSGTLGLPGDLESLARLPYELITGNESKTFLPTSEDIEKRLPFRGASQTPVGQMFTGAGQLAGGAYTGPLSGARAVMAVPRAVRRAGQDFAMASTEGIPRMFIGPKAKTWDKAKADAAARMEQEGRDPVDIWRQTGTFRGADGIQRQEISDVGAIHRSPKDLKELGKQKKQESLDLQQRIAGIPGQKDMFPKALTEAKRPAREQIKRLREEADELGRHSDVRGQSAKFVLEHPELYRAYPELADINVLQGGRGSGEFASLMGGKGGMEMEVTQSGLIRNPRSSMLHEMQHAIQTLEDMAPGGNPQAAFRDPRAFKILEDLRAKASTPMSFEEYARRYYADQYSNLANKEAGYQDYLKSIPGIVKGMERELQGQAAMEYYKRLAGEAEARATQTREGMTASQRAQEFPYTSYDVLPEDLIVRNPTGSVASLQTVYHGSPHKFDRFDASKIGTGEGAQAYGHGLYFAEAPGVAEDYRRTLAGNKLTFADDAARESATKLMPFGFEDPVAVMKGALGLNNDVASAVKTLRGSYDEDPNLKAHANHLADLLESGAVRPERAGHLYTVDLPDEKIARMLDWDKPLSEQPEVIKALKGTDYEVGISQKEAEKIADLRLQDEANDWADMTGGDPVDYMNNANWEKYVDQVRRESGSIDSEITGKELHRMIMRDEGYRPELFDPENYQIGTSEALRGYGIPGIRYLDASSRDAGKGTSNFVVFPGEEDALTILERKKEGGEVKMAKGGSTSDELRRLLGGGMKDGGAAFGRYTTGKKYQKAVKQAKEADVNKLPDPRTYAFVSGLLGGAPDQLGFSVMHPDYKGIQRAGERGFVGGTVLGVAPVVAPLTRGLPVGAAIKPVGGNWLSGSVEKALKPLKTETVPQELADELGIGVDNKAASAINNWIDRNLANYVKKQMATPDDPVRKLAEEGVVHIPSEQVGINRYLAPEVRRHYGTEQLGKSEAARAWEDSADVAVSGDRIKDFFNNAREPWMANADPNTMIYSPIRASQADFGQGLGFDHIIDVLKQDLDAGRIRPEQLSKVSMEQAVRRTYEFDQEMAKRMREAQIKATEGMPVHKEYPEGYRWLELTAKYPEELPEGFGDLEKFPKAARARKLDEPDKYIHGSDLQDLIRGIYRNFPETKGNPEKALEAALKYEGDTMGHCVGGYCPDVLAGRKRVYSLRDAKGEPHVTIETKPGLRWNERSGVFSDNPGLEPSWVQFSRQVAEESRAKGVDRPNNYILQYPEWLKKNDPETFSKYQNIFETAPESIVQIKGKGNRAPNEQYLPFVQDFVRSGQWSGVGDLPNTGLRPTSDAFNETEQAFLRSKGVELKPYINPEETARYQELFKRSSDASPEAGMKAGGAVGCGCNDEPKMQAGGAAKALRNLLKPRRTEEPSLPLDLPRAPAKTREEIRPAAQRMAEQMTGEFVRPNPKKSINPANKSRVQFERERGLTHDIRPTPGGILLPQQVADIEKQKGMLKIGVSGDTTIADKSLYRAGPYKLDMPSPQHGGPLYALGGEGAWASNNPVAANFQRRVQELSRAHGEAPVLGQFLAMGPQGSNFALHFADANLRAIDPRKMSKQQVEMFNNLIREGSDKSGPRPSFPGIEDKDSAYLHFAFDTELRKHFNAMMQKPDYTSKLGLPDGRVILHAITEPELRNTEVLTSGLSQMRLDPSVNPADLALSVHPTYSHVIPKVPGSDIGRTKYPMAAEIEFPDVAEFVRQNYRPKDVTRVYQTATPRQIVDQQHIDEIKMYEELMKQYTGKKKGGKVGPLSAVEKV